MQFQEAIKNSKKKKKWGKFCFRCFWSWILFICHICVVSRGSFSKDLEVGEVPYQLLRRFAGNLGLGLESGIGIGNAAKLWWSFRLFGIFSAWDFFRFPCWKQPKNGPNAYCTLFFGRLFGNCSNMPILKSLEPFWRYASRFVSRIKTRKNTCFCIRTSTNLDTSNHIQITSKSYEINSHHWFDL